MSENTLLRMESIDKFYSKVQVLKNVDFELRAGEVHGLLGENGAGKSTLIKVLMGIVPNEKGQIFLKGKQVNIKNPYDAYTLGINAVFQELSQQPSLSVAENVFLTKEAKIANVFMNRKQMIRSCREYFDSYNINIDPTEVCGSLTSAQKQLTEIIKAIANKPKILILDEPTSSLTEAEIDSLYNIIRIFKKEGAGIIYISHRMEEIFEITDRVTVLRDGELIGTESIKKLNIDKIVTMMVGREVDLYSKKDQVNKSQEIALELKNLTKTGVFHNINLRLKKGEILGIAGLVGSGRSELMKLIFGIDKIDSGQILINDEEKKIDTPSEAIKCGIAMIPEDRHGQGLVLMHTIEQNLFLPNVNRLVRGLFIKWKKITRFAQQMIKDYSIKANSSKQIVRYLSGGNQQKVVVSKWLSTTPKVLIVDEPTAGIDVHSKAEIHKLLTSLTEEGVSIIMVSSEMPELLSMSDRIIVLNHNRIIAEFEETNQEEIMSAILKDNKYTSVGG